MPRPAKLRLSLNGDPHRLEEAAYLRDNVGEGQGGELRFSKKRPPLLNLGGIVRELLRSRHREAR